MSNIIDITATTFTNSKSNSNSASYRSRRADCRPPGRAELVLLGLSGQRGADADDREDPYTRRGWTLLGEQTVGFAVDRDVIDVNQSEDWFRNRRFRALHIVAERNDVHLMGLRIVYLNEVGEDLRIEQRIAAGESSEVDLRGTRSFIRQIELTYRSRPGFGGRALVGSLASRVAASGDGVRGDCCARLSAGGGTGDAPMSARLQTRGYFFYRRL